MLGAGTLNRCNVLLIIFIGDYFGHKISFFCFLKVCFPIYENSIAFCNEGLFQFLLRGLALPGYATIGFYQMNTLGPD